MNNKDSYAIIPNVAFGFGTEYQLTKDEMMVYVHLQFMKQYGLKDTARTTLDMLIDDLSWSTSGNNASRDRKHMQSILTGLQQKGYISISFYGKMSKSILTITINNKMKDVVATSKVDWKNNPFTFKGFTSIALNEYNLADAEGHKMIVIAYIKWRNNAQFTYQISFKEWEDILQVTDKTARTIIENCNGIINKESGAFYKDEQGQYKQEANAYSLNSKTDVKEAEKKAKNESHFEKFREKVTDLRFKFDDEVLKQINDYGTKFELKGYTAWVETDCPFLKKAGEKKFKILEDKGQGWIQEKLEKEYEERQSHKKHQHEMIEKSTMDYEFHSNYKKPEKSKSDFSDYLDDAM